MRKPNTRFYVTAGIITLFIFSFGVLLGVVIEGERLSYLESKYNEEKLNYESLQTQYLYLSYLPSSQRNESCSAFSTTLNTYLNKTEDTRIRLENYVEKGNIRAEDFKTLKREYVLSQINYWTLSSKTKELCGKDLVTLLYFHSKACGSACSNQGKILDYMKKIFGDKLLIFAFDSDFEEPMISILKETNNVTETPTIVLEDKKYVGFTSKDVLLKEICSLYRNTPPECS